MNNKYIYRNIIKKEVIDMITKKCDVCGNKFETEYDTWFNYCSDECKREGKRLFSTVTKECKICGRKFEADRDNMIYCSDECRKEANRIRNRERYHSVSIVIKVCEICGKKFEGHGNAKYCCDECRKEADRIRRREKYESAKPVTKVCKICGREFKAKYRTIYCSDECREEGYKEYREKHRSKKIFFPLVKTCKICGNNYVTIFENSVYCSAECRKRGERDIVNKSWKKNAQKKIAKLNEKYDGDIYLILEDCPSHWYKREAIMQVEYGVSYVEAMYQKAKLNPVCEITGESGNLVIHHLDSFNTHPEKGADLDNLVRIKSEIHDEFHKIYGKGNNTREQWFEFVETFK